MYEGDGLNKTGDLELDYEILRWFNNRMIDMVSMYIDVGNDSSWDEDYFMQCFPRNFIEENFHMCKQIVLDIRDVLISDIIHTHMRLLYQYVLYNIIINQIEWIDELWENGFEVGFSPMENETIKKIYNAMNYTYIEQITEEEYDDEEHPIHFIEYLQSQDIFYDSIFDDTEFDIELCDGWVMHCTEKIKNKEWVPYDLEELLDIASRPIKDEYYKVCKDNIEIDLSDEMFIIQEIDSVIKLLCNRSIDIEKLSENEISNYIEYMLKRLLYLNRKIEIEREAILGFSNKRLGEADMMLYRNDGGYDNIAIIESKFYNSNFKEIKQLLGYLNMHFKFGVTITISNISRLSKAMEAMQKYLENEKESLNIIQIEKIKEYVLCSTMKNSENKDQLMNCYHFILNINEDERKQWAMEARR